MISVANMDNFVAISVGYYRRFQWITWTILWQIGKFCGKHGRTWTISVDNMDDFVAPSKERGGYTKSLHGQYQNMDDFSGKHGQFQGKHVGTWLIAVANVGGHKQFQWQTWEDTDNFSGKQGRTETLSVANMEDTYNFRANN